MKVLELFSGSRSVGKVAEKYGMEVFSVDNTDYPDTDFVGDILAWDYTQINFVPNFIWTSPPCTAFCVACIGKKRVKGEVFTPKTKDAELGIEIMLKTMEIIKHYLELNPKLIWYVENPRGKMRKSPHWTTMNHVRHTAMYCQYGDHRMKPTDIWTNDMLFTAKTCKNYKYDADGNVINRHCHHDLSQRGSTVRRLRSEGKNVTKGGTETMKNNHERSKIPQQLCKEVIKSLIKNKQDGI